MGELGGKTTLQGLGEDIAAASQFHGLYPNSESCLSEETQNLSQGGLYFVEVKPLNGFVFSI